MNTMIKKIACAGIALMFVLGAFTGCKSGNSNTKAKQTVALPSFTSVKDPDGSLAKKGTVGNIKYEILGKENYGTQEKKRGYYVDQLEQMDSPYFIVVTAGSDVDEGTDIKIVDLGMQGSKLVIVVEESFNPDEAVKRPKTPCCVLEVDHDHMPGEILIVSTSGEEFKSIST